MKATFLTFCAILISSCACPLHALISEVPREVLIPVTQELWDTVPTDAQDIWTFNALARQKTIEKHEGRIKAHNGE